MKSVLEEINTKILKLTNPRNCKVKTSDGQLFPCKLVDMFGGRQYIIDFITVYLKSPTKKEWLKNSCNIDFTGVGKLDEGMKCAQTPKERKMCELKNNPVCPKELNMNFVLANLPDFKSEKSALKHVIECRGHICMVSVKCHPEMAGNGIEYAWGYGEMSFRKINDKTAKNLELNVRQAVSIDNLPINRIYKYERRTGDYMQLYLRIAQEIKDNKCTQHDVNFKKIETMKDEVKKECRTIEILPNQMRLYKSHRKAGEIDREFITNS